MAEKNLIDTPTAQDSTVEKRDFWATYSRPIIYVGTAVILIIAGWFGYQQFIKLPKEKNANEAIFPAENLFDKMAGTGFNKDSVNIVLNGGNLEGAPVTGLLKIINNYGGTEAGNRAKYMTGASYLHIGEFDKAIKYLKDFDAHGALQVESKAYEMIGHAYAEQKKTDDALSYYKKAAEVNDKDESITPDALMVAASYAEATGKTNEAIELFKKLRDNYPTSTSVANGDVDKNLAKLGVTD
jgi:tetratricopeptide (TPR) repeat protein